MYQLSQTWTPWDPSSPIRGTIKRLHSGLAETASLLHCSRSLSVAAPLICNPLPGGLAHFNSSVFLGCPCLAAVWSGREIWEAAVRGKFQQSLPMRYGEGETFWSQGKLNRKRESTKRVLEQAFKWQQSVGMQVSSGVRQLTQESGTQNKPTPVQQPACN